MREVWQPFNEFIELSNMGRVKTHGKLRKGEVCKNGYLRIHVSNNGNKQRFLIHRIVATVFIPNPKNLPCVNHIDGNKENNAISNLEWCSYSENEKHAYRTGLKSAKGELNGKSVLTEQQVIEMRKIRTETGLSYSKIGKLYSVSEATARYAINGKNWSHIKTHFS